MTRATQTAPATYDASGLVSGGQAMPDRTPRAGTGHGWSAVIAGLLFAGPGLALAGSIVRKLGRGMPPPMLVLVCLLSTAAGLWVLVHGVRDIGRMGRLRRLRAAHPGEPWQWDHLWDERGARDDPLGRAGRYFVLAVYLFAFLTPLHWIGFFAPRPQPVVGLVALLFDAVGVGLLIAAGYFFVRRLKHGPAVALFERFPFRRGSTLDMYVEAPPTLPQHAVVTATLRCVQERDVPSDRGEHRPTTECFEVYRDVAQAELVGAGAGRRALRVSFAIPADAPTTDLASHPCRYWEVDVEAVTDGVDYAARFLVPVY